MTARMYPDCKTHQSLDANSFNLKPLKTVGGNTDILNSVAYLQPILIIQKDTKPLNIYIYFLFEEF